MRGLAANEPYKRQKSAHGCCCCCCHHSRSSSNGGGGSGGGGGGGSSSCSSGGSSSSSFVVIAKHKDTERASQHAMTQLTEGTVCTNMGSYLPCFF